MSCFSPCSLINCPPPTFHPCTVWEFSFQVGLHHSPATTSLRVEGMRDSRTNLESSRIPPLTLTSCIILCRLNVWLLVTNEKQIPSCPHLPLESSSKLHCYPVGIPQAFLYGCPSKLTQWLWKQGFSLFEQNLIPLPATCKIIILAFIYLFFKLAQIWVHGKC